LAPERPLEVERVDEPRSAWRSVEPRLVLERCALATSGDIAMTVRPVKARMPSDRTMAGTLAGTKVALRPKNRRKRESKRVVMVSPFRFWLMGAKRTLANTYTKACHGLRGTMSPDLSTFPAPKRGHSENNRPQK
ncbi:MAG: hypothetical protein O3C45_05220, partial [Bacteroidetes bacterium]|nr:hypothetical protein [Bacteroidota bacterium]